VLYRAIRRTRAKKILEIGIADTARTVRMIRLAERYGAGEAVRYAAIDLFEARPKEQTSLSLKDAHRLLKSTGAQVQLIPGEPASALARMANSLANVDLLLISSANTDAALEGAWFYVPRMLHTGSAVFREADPGTGTVVPSVVDHGDIQTRAAAGRRRAA
jgi:hypothetical protein